VGQTASAVKSSLYRIIFAREAGILSATIIIGISFSFSSPVFLSYSNMLIVGRLTAYVAIVGIVMTLLLASGAFDLSVGSIFALSAVMMAHLAALGLSVWILPFLSFAIGAGLGYVNGFLTTKIRLPAFIVTLGTLFLYRSLAMILSGGWPVLFPQPPEFRAAFGGDIFGLSTSILWLILIAFVFWFILTRTRYGNWSLATGGGEAAAIAAGVNTKMVKTINFMLIGALTSFNGLIQMSRMNSIAPTSGMGLEFESIGAAVIGGTSLFGGSATVLGTILGAFFVSMVRDGLTLMGVGAYYFEGFLGAIVIIAVIINTIIERRRK